MRWYEASTIAKGINAFCNFFIRHGKESVIVKMFLHGFCTGEWWKNSMLYTAMCLFLQGKDSDKQRQKSGILTALLNIPQIPLTSIGAIILSFAAALLPIMLLFGKTEPLNMAVIAAVLLLGVLCLILRRSLYSLYLGSKLFKFIGGFFYDGTYSEPKDTQIPLLKTCIFAAVLGAIGGMSNPIFAILAVCAILFAAVVLMRFEIGVFATLFLAALLPTSLVAGLCVLTILGFILALFTGRIRNLRPTVLAPILAFYVLLGMFSTATSFDVAGSAFVFVIYFVFICAYVIIANTLNTKAIWRAAVVTFAMSAAFIALLGIAQNYLLDSTTQNWIDSNMFQDIKTRVYATFD
ncbi:MAG: hypothetical protein IJN59_00265, partial [Oscillospiraceae bacterium]|nr:hypothetical protein [Oscillospiraceae bacterium]